VLLNYHISRFVLGSLCVGDLVRLGLSSVRVGTWPPDSGVSLFVSSSRNNYSTYVQGKIRIPPEDIK